MSGKSDIEWTDATWNPIVGCSVVSPGCTNCYAMKLAGRRLKNTEKYKGLTQDSKAGPVWNGHVRFWDKALLDPLHWRQGRKIFVNSEGDLFHESIPDEWIDRVFAVMALCPQHMFQVLTKRAERMRDYCASPNVVARIKTAIEKHGNSVAGDELEDFTFFGCIGWRSRLEPCHPDCAPPCDKFWASDDPNETRTVRAKDYSGAQMRRACQCYGSIRWDGPVAWPLPNVWLGVSAERQQEADERVPLLMQTPAAVRFISAEPLLGPLTISYLEWARLDWVICGGESGSNARPMHPDWARSLRDQCEAADIPFFFKQWGEWLPGHHYTDELKEYDSCQEQSRFDCMDWNGDEAFKTDGLAGWDDLGDHAMWRVGKKRAGRLLDGKEHNEFPQAAAPGSPVVRQPSNAESVVP